MAVTGYFRANITKILIAYFEKSFSEIVTREHYGNHRNLSFEEESRLLESFVEKAEQGLIIEVNEIKATYEEKVGHYIGERQIYYVLARHGWRKVMPRSCHPKKADNKVVEVSKN